MSVSTMKKLTVLADTGDADAIVRKLMDQKCVDIRNTPAGQGLAPIDLALVEQQRADAERLLQEIRRILPHLAKYTLRPSRIGRSLHEVDRAAFCHDGRRMRAIETVERTVEVLERVEAKKIEKVALQQLISTLEPWLAYDAPINLSQTASTVILFGSLPIAADLPQLWETLEEMGAYAELVSQDAHSSYLALTCLQVEEDAVLRVLTLHGFLKATLPELAKTARVATEETEQRLEELDAELLKAEESLCDLAERLDEVEILFDVESTTVNVCLQKRKLAATKHCAVLTGWVPTAKEAAVSEVLEKFVCVFELTEPSETDEPPVLLRNNKWASSFEWVVGMYSYPKYGSFDPTFIMSIFYFLLFGLMFADVGYGLILVAVCFGGIKLLRPKPGLERMLMMFGYCGISCMLMGVLFGGWFGDLPTAIMQNLLGLPIDTKVGHFFSSGLWLNPIDDPMTFLIIALGMGAVHLIAGMAVKLFLLCRAGKVMEGICTIVPFWILFAGFGLFLVDTTVAAYVTVAGAVLVLVLNGYGQKTFFSRVIKGLGGLYSLINYASDLLSYSRVLALGMVAGVVAKVINMITALGSSGPIGFFFMLIILLLGHALNIGINILGTFVHTARLQYIEFFGKFYEDGGDPFDPALPSEEYSEDISTMLN